VSDLEARWPCRILWRPRYHPLLTKEMRAVFKTLVCALRQLRARDPPSPTSDPDTLYPVCLEMTFDPNCVELMLEGVFVRGKGGVVDDRE